MYYCVFPKYIPRNQHGSKSDHMFVNASHRITSNHIASHQITSNHIKPLHHYQYTILELPIPVPIQISNHIHQYQ